MATAHRSITGVDVHAIPAYTQSGDPGAVGAGKVWHDTDDDKVYMRNDDNSGWIELTAETGLAAHLADTSDAHDASAISFTPNGSIAASNVQDAIQEVRDEAVSGSVATDAIFDAKGDLAVGTGANTAAKLTVGANDTIPIADSAEATGIKWAAASVIRTALGLFGLGGSGDRWGTTPQVGTDGVMEIGRYLDFHNSDGDTTDHAIRVDTGGGTTDLFVQPFGGSANRVFRVGGADVPIADGGTGASTAVGARKAFLIAQARNNSTSTAAGASVDIVLTWDQTMTDTSYSFSLAVGYSDATNRTPPEHYARIETKSATQLTVRVKNNSAVAEDLYVSGIAIHD